MSNSRDSDEVMLNILDEMTEDELKERLKKWEEENKDDDDSRGPDKPLKPQYPKGPGY